MVSEETAIRRFVFKELHRCSDLSTLTLGILRRKYLEHVGKESLSVEYRQLLKRIVEEELLKMQGVDSDDEPLVRKANPSQKQNKRKREDDDDEAETENSSRVVSQKKKSRFDSVAPDSPDSGIEKAANEEVLKEESDKEEMSEEEQEEMVGTKKKRVQKNARLNRKKNVSSESEEEKNKASKRKNVLESEEEEQDSSSNSDDDDNHNKRKDTGQKKKQKVSSDSKKGINVKQIKKGEKNIDCMHESETTDDEKQTKSKQKHTKELKSLESEAVRRVQKEVFGSSSESEEDDEEKKTERKKVNQSEKSEQSDSDSKSDDESDEEINTANLAKDKVKEEKMMEEQKDAAEDSDSSLPSLESEEEHKKKPKQEEKMKSAAKMKKKEEHENKTKEGKDEENKAVSRLKRYIALCGVRRNYKKLLEGCRSVKSKVAVLKKELEELGVEGQPSIEKCKKARLKREEAQELAELDVGNIITTQGRPKRKSSAFWTPKGSSSSLSAYKRAVNSDSDSEDKQADRGGKRTTDWGNLRGIISDDAESD